MTPAPPPPSSPASPGAPVYVVVPPELAGRDVRTVWGWAVFFFVLVASLRQGSLAFWVCVLSCGVGARWLLASMRDEVVLPALVGRGAEPDTIDDVAGYAHRRPRPPPLPESRPEHQETLRL